MPYGPQPPSPKAPWPRRAGGYLLDLVTIWAPFIASGLVSDAIDEGSVGGNDEMSGFVVLIGLAVSLGVTVFQLIREGSTGQTLGHQAFGIRAVCDRDGRLPGFGLTLARRLLQFINYPLFGIGWWWSLGDARGQTFADKITSVIVVPADLTPAPPPGFPQPGLHQPGLHQ